MRGEPSAAHWPTIDRDLDNRANVWVSLFSNRVVASRLAREVVTRAFAFGGKVWRRAVRWVTGGRVCYAGRVSAAPAAVWMRRVNWRAECPAVFAPRACARRSSRPFQFEFRTINFNSKLNRKADVILFLYPVLLTAANRNFIFLPSFHSFFYSTEQW